MTVAGLLMFGNREKYFKFSYSGSMRVPISEAFKGGASDPRNPILHQIFSYLGYGERAGSGLYNIKAIWNEKGWNEPKIEERLNPNRTTLILSTEKAENKNVTINDTINDTINITIKLSKTEKKIMDIIANNSNITQQESKRWTKTRT